MVRPLEIELPEPHPGQVKSLAASKRFNARPMGRRFGKSTLAQIRLVEPAVSLQGKAWPVAYFTPTYKLLADTWRELSTALAPIMARKNTTERRMELLSGGTIDFWTLEDEDAGRGRKYKRIIIDEAGMVAKLESIWNESIRPTLADYRGDADFYGTPKGRNFFYRASQLGMDKSNPDWSYLQLPTWANPYIPRDEIEAMRPGQPGGLTERAWRQEVLAEFLEDGGLVFRFVREAVGDCLRDPRSPAERYYAGLDLGKSEDYTVLTVVDGDRNVVFIDRFNKKKWSVMKGIAANVLMRYNNPPCYVDSTGLGDPVFEDLQSLGLNVWSYHFTNTRKAHIIEGLVLAFENGEITIPDDDQLISELEAFESEMTLSGRLRYGAPEGFHDDMVISLALANYASREFAYDQPPGGFKDRVEEMLGGIIVPSGLDHAYRASLERAERRDRLVSQVEEV